jgi:hypothetical protein
VRFEVLRAMTEAVSISETPASFSQTAWGKISKDSPDLEVLA